MLPFLTHGRALLPGRVMSPADHLFAFFPWAALAPRWQPSNPVLSDVSLQLHPWLVYGAGEIAEGRFPLWNPFVFAGAPFFGNVLKGLLFPLTALTFILPIPVALGLMSILKLATAGLAMFWCLRVLSIGPTGAFVGGLSFMFSAPMVVWLQYPLASVMLMLPLLVGTTERVCQRPDLLPVAWLAVGVALSILAGYPQVALLGLIVSTAWASVRTPAAARGAAALGRYGLGVMLGGSLAAVQILPFVEYVRESAIYAYRADWMAVLHLPARTAIAFLMPHYYGSRPGAQDFWGPFNPNEVAVSVGLVPWIVLPVALLGARHRAVTGFFLALSAVAGAVPYGVPPIADAVARLPALSFVIGLRLTVVLAFALCVLCAVGVDALRRDPGGAPPARPWTVKVCFLVLAGAAFLSVVDDYSTTLRAGMRVPIVAQYLWFVALLMLGTLAALAGLHDPRARWSMALAAVQLGSLGPLALTYNPVIDARLFYPTTPALERLRLETERDRSRVLLLGNVSMLWGLSEIAGDDGMTPRRLERLVRPGGSISLFGHGSLDRNEVLASPALHLLGIRRIVAPPGTPTSDDRLRLEYDGWDARIYRNESAFPRAFLVPGGRCVDDETALRLIVEDRVDLRAETLLAGCTDPPVRGELREPAGAEIVQSLPNRVVVRTVSDVPGYLVLTDTWFPGWRVRIDGGDRVLWRANYALRAVTIDAGPHSVEFSYEPRSVQIGLGISLLAACVIAGIFAAPWLRTRRPRRVATR